MGLGPVGATAANLADALGLTAPAFDRATAIEPRPRALGFDHEAMRVFGNLGLGDALAPHTMSYRPTEYRNRDGPVIRRIDTAPPPYPLGWAPNYVFLQPELEGELRRRLTRSGTVEVSLGTTVTDVETDAEGARVDTVDAAGRRRTVRTRYVLACDGGGSRIRAGAGLPLRDLEFDEPWLVVDVLLRPDAGAALPVTNIQYCEPDRPSTYVVGPGALRRWEFMINEGEDPAALAEPDAVRALLSRWLAPDEYDLWRASAYRFHSLVLRRRRAGRLFLLGTPRT